MKMIDMKLVILPMLLLFIGVLARPEGEETPPPNPSEPPSGPPGIQENGSIISTTPPPEEPGNRRRRASSSDATLQGVIQGLPKEVEDILASVLKLVEAVPSLLTNLTAGENPVDIVQSLLELLEKNPINELLTGLPIIGSVVQTVENILKIPIGIVLNLLRAVVNLLEGLLGGLAGISSTTTESSLSTMG